MHLPHIGQLIGNRGLRAGAIVIAVAIPSFLFGRHIGHDARTSHFDRSPVKIASHQKIPASDSIDVAGFWLLTEDSLAILKSVTDKAGSPGLLQEVGETTWALALSATVLPIPHVSTRYWIGVRHTFPFETRHYFLDVGQAPLFPAGADAKLIGWRIVSVDSEEPEASQIKQFSPEALSGIVIAQELDPDRWAHLLFAVGKTSDGRIVLQQRVTFENGTQAILAWCKVTSRGNR